MADKQQYRPRVIAVPSDRAWFDPRLLLAATEVKITTTVVAPFIDTQFLPANPSRLMLIIPQNLNLGFGTNIAPWPINGGFYLDAYQATASLRYTLFDYPGLVTNAWYVNNNGGGSISTIEVLRKGG